MPIYEYECDDCCFKYEVKRGFDETGGGLCPQCGKQGRQIFFAPPLHFKGSGFYVTDTRPKSASEIAKAKAEAPKSESSAPAAAPTGSSAATPAPKPAESKSEAPKAAAKPDTGEDLEFRTLTLDGSNVKTFISLVHLTLILCAGMGRGKHNRFFRLPVTRESR